MANEKLIEKIYNGWAFSENESEKAKINQKIYQEIKDKAKVKLIKTGYGHKVYKVIENPEKLSSNKLALIADHGNLCFGYRMKGNNIIIHTD